MNGSPFPLASIVRAESHNSIFLKETLENIRQAAVKLPPEFL